MRNLVPWKRQNRQNADFWAPFAPFERSWFRDFFDEDFFPAERRSEYAPELDVSETGNAYNVSVELPGLDPKDVDVSLENNVLTIRGEKKQEEEKKDKNYHRIERRYGTFTRSLRLPAEVDAEKIEANYQNGVLHVDLPKTEKSKPKRLEIQVKH